MMGCFDYRVRVLDNSGQRAPLGTLNPMKPVNPAPINQTQLKTLQNLQKLNPGTSPAGCDEHRAGPGTLEPRVEFWLRGI